MEMEGENKREREEEEEEEEEEWCTFGVCVMDRSVSDGSAPCASGGGQAGCCVAWRGVTPLSVGTG